MRSIFESRKKEKKKKVSRDIMLRLNLSLLLLSLIQPVDSNRVNSIIDKPHFSGMFFAMTPLVESSWNLTSWKTEFLSMKNAAFDFVVLPHTGRQTQSSTKECPTGTFEILYPVVPPLNPLCYTQVGYMKHRTGTLGLAFEAANQIGLKIHLGLLFAPGEHGFPLQTNGTYADWANQQYSAASAMYSLYSSYKTTLLGFYTEIEESNAQYWVDKYPTFAVNYWELLSKKIKQNLSTSLLVWVSPYSIGNMTRHPTGFVSPQAYRTAWENIFRVAPSLDFASPQDSMGAQGNSFQNASDYLAAVKNASEDAHRKIPQWSNVELFEVWPPSCQWPAVCHGRHPASFQGRIQQQMKNEAMVLSPEDNGASATLIAWEWRSCFSPNAFDDPHIPFPNETKANYDAYMAYLKDY